MEKIKNEECYKQYFVEYNGEKYGLGDKIMYASGGLYKDNKMVPHAEEVEIVALDTWDEYDESDYQSQSVIMVNRVSEDGTYLKDLGDDDCVVYKKGAKKYNEWALFNEIEKIKGDDVNG